MFTAKNNGVNLKWEGTAAPRIPICPRPNIAANSPADSIYFSPSATVRQKAAVRPP